jgi:transposase
MDGLQPVCLDPAGVEDRPAPYAQVLVSLTKQEHIELVWAANYWKTEHRRAAERALRIEADYQERLRQVTQRAGQVEATLRGALDKAHARIRDLKQRLFGHPSERGRVIDDRHRQAARRGHGRRRRGQPRGAAGHGRTRLEHLPVVTEEIALESPACPACGAPLSPFPGCDECEVLEVEVRAYRRLIRRRRYRRTCACQDVPGIVTAPPPARLIERGKFGVSVWVSVLLDKFLYGRPSFRLVQDLADHGLALSMGSLTGGLQTIAPLFLPLRQALLAQLRRDPHWHADETRWEVFVELDGKSGQRWYLWVFQSQAVAYYVLDRSRSASVPGTVLAGVDGGIISCDRHGAYKKFARLNPGFALAFCWAHQRRDLLNLANGYPHLEPWAMGWVRCIGNLFALHAARRDTPPGDPGYTELDRKLRATVHEMADKRDAALADPTLPAPAVKVLRSMCRHWAGLTTFVEQAALPLDNNAAERALRMAVVGRKNFYGSGSCWSGQLAATLYSVLMTMRRWQINPRTWLSAYLQACAEHGNRPPPDLDAFLPWTMDAARLAAMRATPGRALPVARAKGVDTS